MPVERAAYLVRACGDHRVLRTEVDFLAIQTALQGFREPLSH
jgi:hypothetical protein